MTTTRPRTLHPLIRLAFGILGIFMMYTGIRQMTSASSSPSSDRPTTQAHASADAPNK